MNTPSVQRGFFLSLLVAVTAAFCWILTPFFGAILWGVALAILFTPSYKRLLRMMKGRSTVAALTTMGIVLVIVILPLSIIAGTLVQDVASVAQRIRSGDLNFVSSFQQIVAALPAWLTKLLDRFDLGNFEGLMARLTDVAAQGSQLIAQHALNIGQNTFNFFVSFFVMLYLLFFLLRDGASLSRNVREAVPLAPPQTQFLLNKFTTVIRATVKGNVVVAATQGALGGIALALLGVQGALLWGVVMAFLSLLPAVGAALVWGPVAAYFLATGAIAKGVILIVVGVFVIGLVDNILRPILVGKDTQIPDYVVLITTIGGMALFGINGFVIGPVVAALFIAVWALFTDPNPPGDQSGPPPTLPPSPPA